MTNRIVLGKRGSDYGLWISKPGYDATTATAGQLLFSTGAYKAGQIILQGQVLVPRRYWSFIVTYPDLGYDPVIGLEVYGWAGASMTYLSRTQAQIEMAVVGPDYVRDDETDLPENRVARYTIWSIPIG